ncbi:MAG TPA: DUF1488 family protein [Hyphomicrobiaceae bacterium]|jgi:hypothetical protein|nr:DUF1488 family protein [Hyphomicrobiaceae bacterium]
MPLTATTPDAICDRDAISFVMLDGDSFVRVDVPRSVLDRMTSLRSQEAQLAAFNERRPAIERIASAKYDAGDFCGFANSRVVPIAPDDLLRLAAEGHA